MALASDEFERERLGELGAARHHVLKLFVVDRAAPVDVRFFHDLETNAAWLSTDAGSTVWE